MAVTSPKQPSLKLSLTYLWLLTVGQVTILELLDLSAAFNTVDQTILINLISFFWNRERRIVLDRDIHLQQNGDSQLHRLSHQLRL